MATSLEPGYEDLLTPPPRRARGIKSDYWLTGLVLGLGCFAFLAIPAAILFFRVLGGEGYDAGFFSSFFCIAAIVFLPLFLLALFALDPQFRSVRSSRRRYRNAWSAIKTLGDRMRDEVFNGYFPVLKVDGRALFVVSFRHRLDQQLMLPIATLLLDEEGRVIQNDQLFEKAYTVFNFALFTTAPSQARLDKWNQDVNKLHKKAIPHAAASLERNRPSFEQVGEGKHLQDAVEGLVTYLAAMEVVRRFLLARQAYVKAVGYGHGSEFLFEDADRFHRLSVAFAKKLEDEFGQPVQELSLVGEALLLRFQQTGPGWKQRKRLERALKLIAGSRVTIQRWIYDFGDEARVPQQSWENYHTKTKAVRAQGVPVYSS